MRRNRIAVGLGAAALLSAGAVPALAQVPLTPRALGMGGAYVAVARGNEVLFLNPANLGLRNTPHWSVSIPQIAVGGTLLGPTFGDLPDIQNFDDIGDERRNEILATIPESGTEARYDLRLPLAAIQRGHFAFGVSYGSVGGHTIGKDIAELIFNGYEEGRTDYSVGDTRGNRATFWDFAAAYGRNFGPISLGVTGHYIHGGTVLRSRLFEPRVEVDQREIEVDYLAVYAKGGQGYGVDVGMAVEPIPSVTVSAAISNLYAKMEWSDELYTRSVTLDRADFDTREPFLILDRYRSSETKVDMDAVPLAVYQTAEALYEEAYFPAIARIGAAWHGAAGTEVSAGYQDRLTDGRLADSWDRIASVGVQQKIPFVTLRAGFASNLEEGSLISAGLSLGPVQFGVARMNEGEFAGASRTGWIGTFGLGVRTRGIMR